MTAGKAVEDKGVSSCEKLKSEGQIGAISGVAAVLLLRNYRTEENCTACLIRAVPQTVFSLVECK